MLWYRQANLTGLAARVEAPRRSLSFSPPSAGRPPRRGGAKSRPVASPGVRKANRWGCKNWLGRTVPRVARKDYGMRSVTRITRGPTRRSAGSPAPPISRARLYARAEAAGLAGEPADDFGAPTDDFEVFPSPASSYSDSTSRADRPRTNAPTIIAFSGSVRSSRLVWPLRNSFETNGSAVSLTYGISIRNSPSPVCRWRGRNPCVSRRRPPSSSGRT